MEEQVQALIQIFIPLPLFLLVAQYTDLPLDGEI